MKVNGTRLFSIIFIILVFIAALIGLQVFFLQAADTQPVAAASDVSAGAQIDVILDKSLESVLETTFKQALQIAQNENKILYYMLGLSEQEIDSLQNIAAGRFSEGDRQTFAGTRQRVLQALADIEPIRENIAQTLKLLTNTWQVQDNWPVYLFGFREAMRDSKNPEVQKLGSLLDRFLSIVNSNLGDAKAIVNAGLAIVRIFVEALGGKLKDAKNMDIKQLAKAVLELDEPIGKELQVALQKLRVLNKNNQLISLLDQLEDIDFSAVNFNELFAPTGLAITV